MSPPASETWHCWRGKYWVLSISSSALALWKRNEKTHLLCRMYVICHFTINSSIISASLRSETFAVLLSPEVPNSSGNSLQFSRIKLLWGRRSDKPKSNHPCSYPSLLFMKRTKWVKEVQRLLTPLSWAEHNCNTFTGIIFVIELWKTKLHYRVIITTSLFSTSSKSLKLLSIFQREPHASSITGWKYIHVCHGNFYIPSETESEELLWLWLRFNFSDLTSLNPQDETRNSESPSEEWNTVWSLPTSPSLHLCKIRHRKMHAFCPVASLSVSHLAVTTLVALHFLQIGRTSQPHLSSAPPPSPKASKTPCVSLPCVTRCIAAGCPLLNAGNRPIHLSWYIYKTKALLRQVDNETAYIQHDQNCLL